MILAGLSLEGVLIAGLLIGVKKSGARGISLTRIQNLAEEHQNIEPFITASAVEELIEKGMVAENAFGYFLTPAAFEAMIKEIKEMID